MIQKKDAEFAVAARVTRTFLNIVPASPSKCFTNASLSVKAPRTLVFLALSYCPLLIVAIIWASQPGFMTEYWQVTRNFYTTLEKVVYFLFFFDSNPPHMQAFLWFERNYNECIIKWNDETECHDSWRDNLSWIFCDVCFSLLYGVTPNDHLRLALHRKYFTPYAPHGVSRAYGLCWVAEFEKRLRNKGKEEGTIAWDRSCVILYQTRRSI